MRDPVSQQTKSMTKEVTGRDPKANVWRLTTQTEHSAGANGMEEADGSREDYDRGKHRKQEGRSLCTRPDPAFNSIYIVTRSASLVFITC